MHIIYKGQFNLKNHLIVFRYSLNVHLYYIQNTDTYKRAVRAYNILAYSKSIAIFSTIFFFSIKYILICVKMLLISAINRFYIFDSVHFLCFSCCYHLRICVWVFVSSHIHVSIIYFINLVLKQRKKKQTELQIDRHTHIAHSRRRKYLIEYRDQL